MMTGFLLVLLSFGGLVILVELGRAAWDRGSSGPCRACGGSGWSWHPAVTDHGMCTKCAGTGRVTRS